MEKQHTQLIIKAFSLVLGWILLYDYVIEPDGRVDDFLTEISTAVSNMVLNMVGYESSFEKTDRGQAVYLGGVHLLNVAHPCNGLLLYVIFLGFILIFPSSNKSKYFISLVGLSIIFIMNIGRIVSLSLISLYLPAFFDFSHHYIFTILLYGVIFLMWMFWINKLLPKPQTA